ncbi:Uncharacterised protein [Chlamydia trachomatis]|nr:Uncharacterised protein [Chlamydia trachomatis]
MKTYTVIKTTALAITVAIAEPTDPNLGIKIKLKVMLITKDKNVKNRALFSCFISLKIKLVEKLKEIINQDIAITLKYKEAWLSVS